MAMSSSAVSYVLGATRREHERLIRQSRIFNPFTERLFRSAGISPGRRVLDIGSGVGDVAMLVAELIGRTGEVVGVERDANTLVAARSRVAEAQLRNVSFVETDVSHVASELNGKAFDAVVGRLILFFVPDPRAVLRSLAHPPDPVRGCTRSLRTALTSDLRESCQHLSSQILLNGLVRPAER